MKKSKTSTGYWKVELSNGGKRKSYKVHRLVGLSFIPNPEGKPYINHIDGNPLNNHYKNLEWCTQLENVIHALETGLTPSNFHKFKHEILKEYVNNPKIGIKNLREKYNCDHKSIRNYLKSKGVQVRSTGELRDKYKIDRKELIRDFESGLSNKEIASKYKTNSRLIATYRYKYKNGVLRFE